MNSLIPYIKSKLQNGSDRSNNIKKNIIGSFFLKGISILVQLLLVPLTLGYLSTELYGIWLTISSVVLWLNFFDIGFSLGLKNRLAEAVARNDFERGRQLVSTTYGMLILIFIPLGIILEFIIPLINWSDFLNVAEHFNSSLVDVVRILVISFVFQMIFNTIVTIVSSFQKVALGNSFSVIGNVISLFVIWLLSRYTVPSLLNMAVAVSFIPVIILVVSSIVLYKGFLHSVRPSITYFCKDCIRDVFSLGIKFFIIQIQMIVILQSSNILITNISDPDYVVYYNIAYRYIGSVSMLFTLILSPIWPAFTEAYTKREFDWMSNIYRKLSRICVVIFIFIWIMVLLSPIAYHIWIGDKTCVPVLMTSALGVYFTVSSWLSIQITLINGIGKVKLQSYVTLFGMFLHIPLSLILGRFIGAYGVVASMTFITVIYSVFFTIQIQRLLKGKAFGIWNE